ncbi:MAG: IS3 family transposase, partial [Pseudonocardiaceae bacterium]
MKKSFDDSDETYGHRRIHAQLLRWNEHCTPELVRGIMRDLDLVPCQPKPWRHGLTQADPAAGPIPDLVERDFTAAAPGEKMVGDITYIPTWEGWVYLAILWNQICPVYARLVWLTATIGSRVAVGGTPISRGVGPAGVGM